MPRGKAAHNAHAAAAASPWAAEAGTWQGWRALGVDARHSAVAAEDDKKVKWFFAHV